MTEFESILVDFMRKTVENQLENREKFTNEESRNLLIQLMQVSDFNEPVYTRQIDQQNGVSWQRKHIEN
jgi:hypothetical protein